jgi:cytochrome c biogenesis factor
LALPLKNLYLGVILKKSLLATLVASFGLVVAGSAFAQAPAKMLPLAAEAVVLTATVDSVDVKKRIVVLKDANGNLAQMNVSKQVNDLDKVKKGDLFVVEHAQAIAVGLVAAPKDAKPGVSGVRAVVISGKGSAKPFEETTDTIYATVKITTIDAKTRIVTSGEKQKVKVDQSVLGLEKFKAGDDVLVEFVDDTAIGFVTPKK